MSADTGEAERHRVATLTLHACTVDDYSLIGVKAVILNRACVSDCCLISANSLIAYSKNIPDRSFGGMQPGRLTDDEGERLREASQIYIAEPRRCKADIRKGY